MLSVGLSLAILVVLIIALSTSTAAFGVYNPGWDGASGLTDVATETDTDVEIVVNTTAYESADPPRTIAVVLSPEEPYSERDRARLAAFVADGGTLVVAEDVGPVGNTLLSAVGAETRFDHRPVRDERHYYRSPAFPVATEVADAPETEGVDQLTLNHGTTLRADDSEATQVLVRTSSFAYLDENRNERLDDEESMVSRPVVVREEVGNGTVIAVSDPSIFINVMLDRPGNRQFAANLFGSASHALLDYSGHGDQPPLSAALVALRGSVLLQGLLVLGGVAAVLTWSRRPVSIVPPLRARARHSIDAVRTRLGLPVRSGTRSSGEPRMSAPDEGPAVSRDGVADPFDADAMAASLRTDHPDWDRERIRRVITGVLARRAETRDDDRSS